jgi:hypothetical protein
MPRLSVFSLAGALNQRPVRGGFAEFNDATACFLAIHCLMSHISDSPIGGVGGDDGPPRTRSGLRFPF